MMEGFAKQSQSVINDWLCGANKTKPNQNELALRSKANSIIEKGFAKQSRSITMERLCEAKQNSVGFAKQIKSSTMERLCKAKRIRHDGKALRSKAKPSQLNGLALRSKANSTVSRAEARARARGEGKRSKHSYLPPDTR